ncbi:M20 family peptidase [Undibacterium jejuense]|uniref:M20 family peptidase n=1 Tax=Undibacterium jejuense TaxID=1344949 RepID=A0A923HMQ3_9BURK|nr:M20 family peptidase [Undibacterium jejuense]MBC3862446.1 M20 family peptidase [Undibacterium jejuense]
MIRRFFFFLASILLVLIIVLAGNTLLQRSQQIEVRSIAQVTIDEQAAADRLAHSLRFVTISSQTDENANAAEFQKLHAFMDQSYLHIRTALKRETIGANSLLYKWEGTDVSLKPILLMAHQDVVPIAPGTEHSWQQLPFAGNIQDGFIWGRGAWDDKGNLFAILEAVEMLLASGYQPQRTVYLSFGHDEEVSGLHGAKAVAELLKSRQIQFEYVLDEGMLVTEGILQGLDKSAALIGVAEKGYASVQLSLDATPGHSSMPPQQTAIGMMSLALSKLEQHQLPADIRGVALDMFNTIAPEMHGINRVVLSNLWLFSPLLQHELEKSGSTNAMLRTTTALTMVHAGNKDNVLPGNIQATVNFRTLPGDTQASVMAHVKSTIDNTKIHIQSLMGNSEPSKVSPTTGKAYETINRTIRETFTNTIVAPGLMLGATDSRYFEGLSENIFKFSPVRAGSEDLPRFHGTNERISIKNYAEMIRFYHQLILNSSKPSNEKEKTK